MAERNPRIAHSIESLLFVKRNGKYCGYKQELINDNISAEWKGFLICAECKGISIKRRQRRGNTVCQMCVTGYFMGDIDERVENKVTSLNSQCPLSEEGCCWNGKLGEIEQHMEECLKVVVECKQKCGILFERKCTDQHNKGICPLRMIQCKYCKQEVHVKEENRHIGECQHHPDREVSCPYMELGCEAIILRKNMEIHLTENMRNHQKLMLDELNQLKIRNEHQRDIIDKKEISQRKNFKIYMNETRRKSMIWTILSVVAVGIAIIIAMYQTSNIQTYTNYEIKSIESKINSKTELNSKQIESIFSSLGYIHEHIEERGKILLGTQWIHDLKENGWFYGPTFYLKQCKLRLKVYARATTYQNHKRYTGYYVERLEGEYDDVINNCKITYIFISFWYLDDIQPKDTDSSDFNINLKVGDSKSFSYTYWDFPDGRALVRFYFDTDGN